MVEVSRLRKTYGDKVAVADVSFAVGRGEIVGILGPNGAGKTTTVESIAGLRTADSGTVSVLGLDPQRDPALVREVLGVQVQESRLPAKLRVAEALRLYASFYRAPKDPEELITLLDLEIEAYECLVAYGYDPVPPPTPQTSVDTYLAEGPWSAHRIPGAVLPYSECPVPHWTDIEW